MSPQKSTPPLPRANQIQTAKRTRTKIRRPTNSQRLGEARVTVGEAHHPRYKFLVTLYNGGKRVERKWFKTKGEADTKAAEYRSQKN